MQRTNWQGLLDRKTESERSAERLPRAARRVSGSESIARVNKVTGESVGVPLLFVRMAALFTRMAVFFVRMATLFRRMPTLFTRIAALFTRMASLFVRISTLFRRMPTLFLRRGTRLTKAATHFARRDNAPAQRAEGRGSKVESLPKPRRS